MKTADVFRAAGLTVIADAIVSNGVGWVAANQIRLEHWSAESRIDIREELAEDLRLHDPLARFPHEVAAVVRTSPRSKSYLDRTLRSLNSAGFSRMQLQRNSHTGNTIEPFTGSLRSGLASDAKWLLLCEDDVEIECHAADYLRQFEFGRSIISLYTAGPQQSPEFGWRPLGDKLAGSLAVLMRRDVAADLLKWIDNGNWIAATQCDQMLSAAAQSLGVPLLIHSPSLSEHIGETSALWPGKPMRPIRRAGTTHTPKIAPVTLVTPTGDRPEAFARCGKWINSQTFTGEVQWIVIDDGETPTACTMGQQHLRLSPMRGHSLCRNLRNALSLIAHDRILIIEDDDFYAPDYISVMAAHLERSDVCGQSLSRYYWLKSKLWHQVTHRKHCSLSRTAFRREALPEFTQAIKGENRSVDLRFWALRPDGLRIDSSDLIGCVTLKESEGRTSPNWEPRRTYASDWDGAKFREWVGGGPP